MREGVVASLFSAVEETGSVDMQARRMRHSLSVSSQVSTVWLLIDDCTAYVPLLGKATNFTLKLTRTDLVTAAEEK